MSRVQVVTWIVIDKSGNIAKPDRLTAIGEGPVAWIIVNHHSAPHKIAIDPASFVNATTKNPENPLATDDVKMLTKTVPAAGAKPKVKVIRTALETGFDGNSYVYDIQTVNLRTDVAGPRIDPDLDVVDPSTGP